MADPHAPTPIRREDHGAVARLVLSSPQNYNALSREMIAALRDALDAIATDEAVRVVVIAAEGKAFCAGMDLTAEGNVFGLDESLTPVLSDMEDLDDPGLARVRDTGGRVALAIHACRKPVIAAVDEAGYKAVRSS